MADTSSSSVSPASARIVGVFAWTLMAVMLAALFVLLGATIPKTANGAVDPAKLVTIWSGWSMSVEQHLALTVLFAGMLGACVHVATSFADYVGNDQYKSNWQWWYLLRPFIGGAVALIFYMLIRGGILSLASGDANSIPNAYGMAAMAALAGMFSKQATDKLDDIFDTLFKTDKDQARRDGLDKPVIAGFDPAEGFVGTGPQQVKVAGTGFDEGASVQVNGTGRETAFGGATLLTATFTAEDLKAVAELSVKVVNSDGAASDARPFKVVERRQAEGSPDDREGAPPAETTTTTTTTTATTTTPAADASTATETDTVGAGAGESESEAA